MEELSDLLDGRGDAMSDTFEPVDAYDRDLALGATGLLVAVQRAPAC